LEDFKPFIKVSELYKSFIKGREKIEVLKGIKFSVSRGERIAIVGASGVGKSTFLHILGALERPTKGNIYYEDINIFLMDDNFHANFRNNRIGFIFQFHYLLSEFSALENVVMPIIIRGVKKRDAFEIGERILVELGLKDRMKHKPGELSGGEQQRVAIGRAIIHNPDILLADEPNGNLDQQSGASIQELLIRLSIEKGITLIVVTHNIDFADRIGNKAYLKNGIIYREREI